jgi:hypothetical protein
MFAEPLARLKRSIERATQRNAAERCRRFEGVPLDIAPPVALEEVRKRSVSLFEPRPEYNHASNAACVVGRRSLTQNLFLDRRVFLNSYNPTDDPEGETLSRLLSAVIPVCAGINLEYCFSRLDPLRYGAGSKLSHNVNGLLGVCNGIEGDLLTGLPTQMTDIHSPIRLLLVVEHTPEVAISAASRNPATFECICNEWVVFASVHPETREVSVFANGGLCKLDDLPAPGARYPSSLDAAREGRGDLPVAIIHPPEPSA